MTKLANDKQKTLEETAKKVKEEGEKTAKAADADKKKTEEETKAKDATAE